MRLLLLLAFLAGMSTSAQAEVPRGMAESLFGDADRIRAALGDAWLNLSVELPDESAPLLLQTQRQRGGLALAATERETLADPTLRRRAWRWAEVLLAHGPLHAGLRALVDHASPEATGWFSDEEGAPIHRVEAAPLTLDFDGRSGHLRRIDWREGEHTWTIRLTYADRVARTWLPSRLHVERDRAHVLTVHVLDVAIDRHTLAPLPTEQHTPAHALPFRRLPL